MQKEDKVKKKTINKLRMILDNPYEKDLNIDEKGRVL